MFVRYKVVLPIVVTPILPFLSETLRKYPPLAMHMRRCNQDYKIPNSDVTIEKGVNLCVPVLAIQKDPEYFPDPERFDPERFGEENKRKLRPFSYMPFGEGPRVCIGKLKKTRERTGYFSIFHSLKTKFLLVFFMYYFQDYALD